MKTRLIRRPSGFLEAEGRLYRANIKGQTLSDGRWCGLISFIPLRGGRAIHTNRETVQRSLEELTSWAAGISPVYLEGALRRALSSTALSRGRGRPGAPRSPGSILRLPVRYLPSAPTRPPRRPPRPRRVRVVIEESTAIRAVPPPSHIKAQLDERVIGQERPKKLLALAAYNHLKRIWAAPEDSAGIQKSNILLLGPTGSGKTLLAETLARALDVPFCIVDATAYTQAGYVGADVEDIAARLLAAAEGDVAAAERGIAYIDEVDKLARTEGSSRDVAGEGVQQGLLKLLEGKVIDVPAGDALDPRRAAQVDTRHVLFMCGGAFVGLEEIVGRRRHGRRVGFGAEPRATIDALVEVQPEDLVAYGMIPELVGRLPIVVALDELDEEDLLRILIEPADAVVKQYQKLLRMDGVSLVFTEDALRTMARLARDRGTGARGLRALVEAVLTDVMYEAGSEARAGGRTHRLRRVVVDEQAVARIGAGVAQS